MRIIIKLSVVYSVKILTLLNKLTHNKSFKRDFGFAALHQNPLIQALLEKERIENVNWTPLSFDICVQLRM